MSAGSAMASIPARSPARSRLRHVVHCVSRVRLGSQMSSASSSSVEPPRQRRVLSIQSHIVHGNLGNKCAVFPLQLLGFEVDNISTVQYSHMGAGRQGTILSAAGLKELVDGLDASGMLGQYSHVLTGWAADADLLRGVADAVRRIRAANSNVVYVCDPVLGDNGALYTPKGLATIYRDELVPQANVLTPNAFEAELLTDLPCTNEEEGLAACAALHAAGPSNVVVTSIDQPRSIMLLGSSTSKSTAMDSSSGQWHGERSFRIDVPKIEQRFGGTGDLLAALLLAHSNAHPFDWAHAVRLAVGSVQGVLSRTLQVVPAAGHTASASGLQLVASSDILLDPPPASGTAFSVG